MKTFTIRQRIEFKEIALNNLLKKPHLSNFELSKVDRLSFEIDKLKNGKNILLNN